MNYREMLLLSYFKNHYKKYDFGEIIKLLGVTTDDLNDMLKKLKNAKLLITYDGYILLSKQAENLLIENKIPYVGNDEFKEDIMCKQKMNINEVYIPKNFEM